MKFFIVFLLLFSCGSKLERGFLSENTTKTLGVNSSISSNLEEKVELFVAFYWPSKIYPKESLIVKNVISKSRKIMEIKDKYYKNKFNPNCEFKKNKCFCVVNNTCETPPSEDLELLCSQIDEKLLEIDMSLIEMAQLIEDLKMHLQEFSSPSEWIETHLDFGSIESPIINLKDKTFKIPVWREEGADLEATNLFFENTLLKFTLEEKSYFSVDLKESKFSIQGMGEIEEIENKKLLRRGVIFFEIDKSESLECPSS